MNCSRLDEYRYRPYAGGDSVPIVCLVFAAVRRKNRYRPRIAGELHETERVDDAVPR